jgi:type I restriction enzyme S subunit
MTLSTIRLGELMLRRGGSVDPAKHKDEEFDLYSIPAFDKGASELVMGRDIGSSKQQLEQNDILLSKIVPHIRRAWVVGAPRGRRQIGSGEWIVFRSKAINSRYLSHVLVGDPFHKAFMQTVSGVGGSLLRARPAQVAEIQIPLPPLDEQKRIAAILDAADALRAKRRQSIAQLDALIQSTFLDLFGDPVTNPMGWPMVTIGDLLTSTSYGTSKKAHETDGAYPCLRMNNITYAGGWDFSSLKYVNLESKEIPKYLVHKGQLLFNRTNSKELVGKTAVYRGQNPMAYAGYLVRGIVNEVVATADFISTFLNLPQGKAILMGMCKNIVGMANINAQEFKTIQIPKPPLPLQQKFAAIVESIERQKNTQRAHLTELDALFAALQHRAFRGEL